MGRQQLALKRLTLKDFKGISETFEFDHLNVLEGPNGSGKSAILEALHWAIEGRTSLGAAPAAAVVPFAAPQGCEVTVELDNGFRFTRRLSIDHVKGKTQTDVDVWGKDLSNADAQAAVAEMCGSFAPMFDLGAFLDLSDDKRRDFVMDLCAARTSQSAEPSEVWTRIQLAYFRLILGDGAVTVALGTSPSLADAARGLADQLGKRQREALEAAYAPIMGAVSPKDRTIAERLARMLETAKELTNAARRAKDEAHQAAQRLADRQAEITARAESAESLRENLAKSRAKQHELRDRLKVIEGQSSGRAAVERTLAQIDRELADVEAGVGRLHPAGNVTEKLASLRKQLAELSLPDLAAAEARVSQLATQLVEAQQADMHAQRRLDSLERQIDQRRRRLADIEAGPWFDLQGRLENVAKLIQLPSPEAVTEWQALLTWVMERAGSLEIGELKSQLEQAEGQLPAARDAYAASEAALDAAKNSLQAAQTELQTARSQHARIHQQRTAIEVEIGDLERDAQEREQTREKLMAKYATLLEQQAEAEKRLAEMAVESGGESVEALQAQLDACAIEIARIESSLGVRDRYATLAAELAATQARAEEQAVAWETYKQIANAIRSLREEIMHELVAPMMARINQFLDSSMVDQRAYCDLETSAGKPTFTIGWIARGRRVAHEAMSGGERVLFGAALAYALVSLSDAPLKLLLIEAAEADHFTAKQLMRAISAVGGDLSNVLLATHASLTSVWDEYEDWHLLCLDFPTEEVATL